MSTPNASHVELPSFLARIGIAFAAFFRSLGNAAFAAEVQRAAGGRGRAVLRAADEDSALQLLALLQREGRLVDFLEEDIDGFSDAQVGAAARVVHGGCRKVVREHLTLAPARAETEGSTVVLQAGFDASAVRLVGNVTGQAPFRGTLQHRGWRATDVRLPKLAAGHDVRVIAPAEVEL